MGNVAISTGRCRAALVALVASAAWLSPIAIDLLSRRVIGQAPYDWPWLTLHFANSVTAIGLIAALAVTIAMRRVSEKVTGFTPWVGLVALSFAFGLVPVVKLTTGLSSDIIMAGLLPALDAEGYFSAALRFPQTGQLTEWATRRPLTALQLAGLFTLTGENFRLVLLLLAAGCAAAATLVTITLYRAYGWVAACLGAVSLFAFIYQTQGSTMSESLGFTMGGAAFVLLWEGASKTRPSLVLAGIGLLSIGLAARAGAMFVIPSLAVWAGWRFAGVRRFHWGWMSGALAVGTAGFLANHALIAMAGAPGQAAFSNFASTLYGLAIGGEPWTRVFIDAPHLAALPEGEQAATIYRLAWEHALRSPLDPILGVLTRYNEFLFDARWHSYVPNKVLRMPILLLSLAGVVHCYRNRGDSVSAFLLAGLAGILLSVPFLGDGGSRVFAASHAFTAALVATGAFSLLQRFLPNSARQNDSATDGLAIGAAALVLAIVIVAPILIVLVTAGRSQSTAGIAAAPSCPPGESAILALTPRNGVVLLCPSGGICPNGVRAESLGRTNIWKNSQVSGLSANLPARVAGGIDANTGSGLRLLATGGHARRAVHRLCAAARRMAGAHAAPNTALTASRRYSRSTTNKARNAAARSTGRGRRRSNRRSPSIINHGKPNG